MAKRCNVLLVIAVGMAVPTNILESISIYLYLLGFDQSGTLSGSGIEQSGSESGSGTDQSGTGSGK